MWLTMMIAAILFAGMLAALHFGYREAERERAEKLAADVIREVPQVDQWLVQQGQWARRRTVDEVVFEVERRIDADLQEVAHLLGRTAPENASRLYRV